ncbi:MAG: ATP-binding protein [Candidatus Korarchaeota archaeon]|nr:ATP-binding protein [Candidatus Korarchaeota archaeon]
MLFDPAPKSRREDLFDFEEELETLLEAYRDDLTRMVVISGLRRTGKTSLLKVSLRESGLPHLIVDGRSVLGPEDLERTLTEGLRRIREGPLRRSLSRLRSLSTPVVGVELDRLGEVRLQDELREASSWALERGTRIVVALDEVQDLRYVGWLPRILAFCYDNLHGILTVLTGSQVRLMEEFLGLRDPGSPLFGRPFAEVRTRTLSDREAREFLEAGFVQAGVRCPSQALEDAVYSLGGVIGWLTYYGYQVLRTAGGRGEVGREVCDEALERTYSYARSLLRSELRAFLEGRASAERRYRAVLSVLARAPGRVLDRAELRARVEGLLEEKIPRPRFSRLLSELERYGFIVSGEQGYRLADPLIALALEPSPEVGGLET